MSSLNVKGGIASERKKESLNTTIDKTILNNFKASCKNTGIPMNVIIETFMSQFVNGEFILKFGDSNNMSVKIPEK